MKRTNAILSAIILSLLFLNVHGQEVSPVDFMYLNPFRINSDAAAPSLYYGCFSMGVGNVNVGVSTSGIRSLDVLKYDAGQNAYLDLDKLANVFKDVNSVRFNVDEEVLGIGRRSRHGFVTFGYRVRVQGMVDFSDDLFRFLANGNADFLGPDNPVDINMNVNLLGFQEIRLGYQTALPSKHLSIGGRVKFLMGCANAYGKDMSLKVFTDPDSYALSLKDDVALRLTSPMPFSLTENTFSFDKSRFDVADVFANPGFGVDLAAEYRFVGTGFMLTAAVNDLGFIKWNNKSVILRSEITDAGNLYDGGDFVFEGFSAYELERIFSDAEFRQAYLDSLGLYLNNYTEEIPNYVTSLHTTLLLRGTYELDYGSRVYAQLQGCCSGMGFRPALTLAYNHTFKDMFDACATYTMMKGSYCNIGLGLSAKLGLVQLYAATNNVLGIFSPMGLRGTTAHFGLVFNICDGYGYNSPNR